MSFWDSSAVIPLCLEEPESGNLRRIARSQGAPVVWWASPVEICSALERQRRLGQLAPGETRMALLALEELASAWHEVQPIRSVRGRALRLLAVHSLRAADAMQLAAALIWAEEKPVGRAFVCLDARLREAAGREGFTILPETPM